MAQWYAVATDSATCLKHSRLNPWIRAATFHDDLVARFPLLLICVTSSFLPPRSRFSRNWPSFVP